MTPEQLERKRKHEENCAALNKRFGKGTVVSSDTIEPVESISSGSLTVDIATGINGIPKGKLVELYGPPSSGKTTTSLHIIAEFQKAGEICVLVDSEHSFDVKYARDLGVNVEELTITQPGCAEDAYNIIADFVKSGHVGLVVFDSHTAAPPKKIVEGEVGESTVGLQARINSSALQKIHALLDQYGCTLLAVSQTRTNIGGYGDPNIATGGKAYEFYSDMILKLSKSVKKDEGLNVTKVEVIKNKCARPFGVAEFNIIHGEGVDKLGEIVDLAVEHKFISKGGAWYTINESKFQGREGAKGFLRDNEEFTKELETKIKDASKN